MNTFIASAAMSLAAALLPVASTALDFNQLAGKLENYGLYNARAVYEVLLPTSQYPVTYDISLNSDRIANSADTLAAASYLIEWSLAKDGNTSEGFSAYFPGNHYRYRDQRLQEYHTEWDATPFNPTGDPANGVQNLAQFCDLLPQYIGKTFRKMQSDTTYKYVLHADTVISGVKCIAVDGARSFKGIEALEFIYIFEPDKLRPIKFEFDSNPGQISEQIITATYSYGHISDKPVPGKEDQLIALYPEVFEKYRESTFRLENMPGRRLPAFSIPTATGERYSFAKNDEFAAPTVIALLDAEVASSAETVSMLRKAIDLLPMQTDLILAFVNNNIDLIEQSSGRIRQGEHILMSARGLARDLGATSYPVIIVCDRSATVKDLKIGFNNDITDFVIQKTATAVR